MGALLFDDGKYIHILIRLEPHRTILEEAPPASESREQDVIQKTLNAIGIKYSHHNDEILVPSRIEEERTKTLLVCWIVVCAGTHGLNVFIEK